MRTIKGLQDFGVWIRKGKIVTVANWLADTTVERGYAKHIREEDTPDGKLLMEYGLEPNNKTYSKIKVLEILKLVEKWKNEK